MDVGTDFSGVELIRQEAGLAEEQVERLPDFAVKLIDVLEVLPDVFPEGLFDVKGVLAALVAIHPIQFGSAILAIGIRGCLFAADTLQAAVFDVPRPLLLPFPQIRKKYIVFHIYFFKSGIYLIFKPTRVGRSPESPEMLPTRVGTSPESPEMLPTRVGTSRGLPEGRQHVLPALSSLSFIYKLPFCPRAGYSASRK